MKTAGQLNDIAKRIVEWLACVLLLLCVTMPLTCPAEASTIQFTGTALGSFDGGPFSSTASLRGLTFTGTTFVAETNKYGRLFGLGPSFVVGQFSLTSLSGLSPSDYFTLELVFAPSGGVSPNPWTVEATLFPNFSNNVLGIDFNLAGGGPPFTFSEGIFKGTGNLGVVSGNPSVGQVVPIRGAIFFTSLIPPVPTPEPGTLVLLGTGLGAIALKVLGRVAHSN